jgi:hypothetical protein
MLGPSRRKPSVRGDTALATTPAATARPTNILVISAPLRASRHSPTAIYLPQGFAVARSVRQPHLRSGRRYACGDWRSRIRVDLRVQEGPRGSPHQIGREHTRFSCSISISKRWAASPLVASERSSTPPDGSRSFRFPLSLRVRCAPDIQAATGWRTTLVQPSSRLSKFL